MTGDEGIIETSIAQADGRPAAASHVRFEVLGMTFLMAFLMYMERGAIGASAPYLGLSVNISTSIEGAEQCCHAAGLCRHSVGYSLGFEGRTEHLPNEDVLHMATMCGHGMVSSSLAKKMIDWVKEDRRTPEQAVTYLALLLMRRV
jgi:hypothetical protein